MGLNQEHNLHGTEDQLELYALGRLSATDLPLLEEHLLTCAACQEHLDAIGSFAVGMREALVTEPKPVRTSAPRTDWFGWLQRPAFSMALGFAALVIVLAVFSNGRIKFVPEASLQLTAMRGEMPITVPARQFDLTLSDGPRDGGPFRVEVVNAMGQSMWSGLADSSPAGVQVKMQQPLRPGDYFVRLYSVSGKVLREYGFRIRA
jgi:hypothetical protein